MAYVVIIIIIIFVIIWYKNGNKKSDEDSKKHLLKSVDTYQRFLEAAKNKIDPREFIGFDAFEQDYEVKVSDMNVLFKDICMALALNNVYFSEPWKIYFDSSSDNREGKYSDFCIYSSKEDLINDVRCGVIRLNFKISKRKSDNLHHAFELVHLVERKNINHCILHFPWFEINSIVAPPEQPPKWLFIVADVIKKHSIPISFPTWANKYPISKTFINTMFD